MSIWVKPLTDNGITGSPEIWPKIFAVDLHNTNTNEIPTEIQIKYKHKNKTKLQIQIKIPITG